MVLKKSLIICYSTPNYEPLANICLETLAAVGVEPQNIIHKIDQPPHYLMKRTGFMTDLFFYCIIQKVKHLIETLRTYSNEYEYYISLDMDIWFIETHEMLWDDMETYVENQEGDVIFLREHEADLANGGFFIIKNANIERTIEWLSYIYKELTTRPRSEMPMLEQHLINVSKHTIPHGYIPNEYVIWGPHIFDEERCLFHHAVCCLDTDTKLSQIQEIKERLGLTSLSVYVK